MLEDRFLFGLGMNIVFLNCADISIRHVNKNSVVCCFKSLPYAICRMLYAVQYAVCRMPHAVFNVSAYM